MADSSVASQHVYADQIIEAAPLPEAHPFAIAAPKHAAHIPWLASSLPATSASASAPNSPLSIPSRIVVRPAPSDREGLQSRGKQRWNQARDELVLRGLVHATTPEQTTSLKWDALLRRAMDPSRWHLVEIKLPDTYAQLVKEYNKSVHKAASERKASLRSMVYTLRQRKRLHPKEVELLERMSGELRQLDHPPSQPPRH